MFLRKISFIIDCFDFNFNLLSQFYFMDPIKLSKSSKNFNLLQIIQFVFKIFQELHQNLSALTKQLKSAVCLSKTLKLNNIPDVEFAILTQRYLNSTNPLQLIKKLIKIEVTFSSSFLLMLWNLLTF